MLKLISIAIQQQEVLVVQVLGVPEGSDGARVEKAYKLKRQAAERAGDKAAVARIEEAHNSIFMASLSSRLKGSGPVDKKIAKADRVDLIPWRPRFARGGDMFTKVTLGVYAATLIFELFLKVRPNGVINGAIVGAIMNTWKLYELFPAPLSDMQKRLEHGWSHIFRSLLLTSIATLVGVLVLWTLPNMVANQFDLLLPLSYQASKAAIMTAGSILCNLGTTLFLR